MNQHPPAARPNPRNHRHGAGLSAALAALALSLLFAPVQAAAPVATFKQVPTQYIAALGDPGASSGDGAQNWGWWHLDPGPRGVRLKNFDQIGEDGLAPARWQFDNSDWWLEENGLIMEQPVFPLGAGQYIVTGGRETFAKLTVHPPDATGNSRWELDKGATLLDVTHLGCRSARYTPASAGASCSPANAPQSAFPMDPGRRMPDVAGCNKQEYAVLFIVGVAAGN